MAGGYGTRLRPLTVKRPKPMLPVANRPMLEHILLLLKKHGFSEIVMLTYFFPETIEEYFGDGSRLGLEISYHQDPPGGLGTAGAVRNISDILDSPFLVISGDVITDFDLTEAWEFHRKNSELATMVLTRVHNPLPFGVVITDEDNRVTRFLEKPSWGEVFSDTINTGIYVLDPAILERIPRGVSIDFSKDIFPGLLAAGNAPAAYVAQGYWKDVGTAVEYLQLHREIAAGIVELDLPGEVQRIDNVTAYIGEGSSVSEGARLSGLVVVGDGTQVGDGARLRDSFIGRHCFIESNVRMGSSVIWSGSRFGRGAFVAGSVIGSGTEVRTRANIEEGSIISEDCLIGRGSIIRAGVRIWPDKIVEDDAVLSSDFVWGNRWRGTLFTGGIVQGLTNREITPEFAARLGAAFAATLPEHSAISLTRGIHRVAKMASEAIASGVLSVGVDVHDSGVMPIPVARHLIRGQGNVGGVNVRRAPSDPEILEIRFYRDEGRELTASERTEIDRLFFRMDFRRATVDGSGTISYPYYGSESYEKRFLQNLDLDFLARARKRIVLDYSFGTCVKMLPSLLGRAKCEVVSLNAHMDEQKATRTTKEFDRAVRQISEYVLGLHAALGTIISASGETLFLIDERGRWIDGGRMLQILALLTFMTKTGSCIAVPASASGNLEKMASQHGGRVIRAPNNASAILDAALSESAYLAGNSEGGVAFPDFHPSFDAMFCLAKTIEMTAIVGKPLGELVDSLPKTYLEHSIVHCPWEAKGQVMRRLVEELGEDSKGIEGVRFEEDEEWVLIYPSSNHPYFHIYAESNTPEGVKERLGVWSRKVEDMQRQ
jgi:mannose-1-phosphate guanylyltransferase/phosphomannomutase